MRYASIRSLDITNGERVGVSLFVQGCRFHCKNCFNKETWDFNGGEEWTEEVKDKFMKLINRPYIKRISILGGEPLEKLNRSTIYCLVKEIKEKFPTKDIWLYTGYTWEEIFTDNIREAQRLLIWVDVLVDGKFIEEQKDLTLKWRGSKNQRVIDVKKSLEQNKIVLYCD